MPDDASVVVVAGPQTDFFPPEIDALKTYLDKAGKLLLELDPPDKADSPPLTNLIALAHDWGIDVGNNIVVDVSGMGRLIGTDASVPVAASYPPHPITQRFTLHDGVPAGARSASPVTGGVNGHTAQSFVETEPAQLGRDRHQGAADDAARCRSTSRRATRRDRSRSRSAVSAAAAPAAPPKPGDAGRAEAGDARRRVRRLRLRRQRRRSASRATATCS